MLPSRMVGRSPRDLRAGDHRDVDYRAILRLRSEWAGRKAMAFVTSVACPGCIAVKVAVACAELAKVRTRTQLFVLRGSDKPVPVLASFPVWPLLAASVPRSPGLLSPSRPEPTSGNSPHSRHWQALSRRRGPRQEWRTSLSLEARALPGRRPGPVRGRRGRQARWLARPRRPPGRRTGIRCAADWA